MAQSILLVRHGDIGAAHRLIGSTDLDLSDQGRFESGRLAAAVAAVLPASCYSSPLQRARQAAAAALRGSTASLLFEPDLREVDFGRWEGLTFDEVCARAPQDVERWAAGASDFAFPGGERLADFLERVERVGRYLAADPAERVLAFTHGGVIRHLICYYLGLPWRDHVLFEVGYGSLTTLKLFDGKGVLTSLSRYT
jgi:alpha-ribazole phosphatase